MCCEGGKVSIHCSPDSGVILDSNVSRTTTRFEVAAPPRLDGKADCNQGRVRTEQTYIKVIVFDKDE